MAFPCICYKCARCITLESRRDPECLKMEEKNCREWNCFECDFTCDRFTSSLDFDKSRKVLYSFKI